MNPDQLRGCIVCTRLYVARRKQAVANTGLCEACYRSMRRAGATTWDLIEWTAKRTRYFARLKKSPPPHGER